jgi:hypothetical protein
MREIRLSGSMRGRHGHGLVVAENQTCLPTLSETKSSAAEKKIETLESKLKRKDEVIAEIMEDFIRAKKQIGES